MIIFNLKGGTYCIDIEEQAKVLLALLKQKELNYINKYTGDAYTKINRILKNKNHDFCSKEIQTIIDTVNGAFTKLPSFKPHNIIILYRGLKLSDDNYLQFLKQNQINDLGFISTTTSIDIARTFSEASGLNSVIMKIYLSSKYNYKVLPVKNISNMPYENEVILPNGSRFVWIKEFDDEKIKSGIIRSYLYVPSDEDIPSQPNSFVKRENTETKNILNSVVNNIISPTLISEVVDETILLEDSDDIKKLLESCIDTFKLIIKNQHGILPETISDNKISEIKKLIKSEIIKQKSL